MEYQNIINLSDNMSNGSSKFRAKNLVKINNYSRGMYNINGKVNFFGL